jgi:DNA-binding IclR family transcriptional regulator
VVLEALRASPGGETTAELMKRLDLRRAQLAKALAKLRTRGLVRSTGGRGSQGMRYLAVTG